MKKKVTYYTDRQLEGLNWTAKVVDFGVSLTIAVAFNELYTAHMMLRERKDLYRQQVKKLANDTVERAKLQRGRMMGLMTNRLFFDTYADKVIDLAENDITMFRISLKQTLDKAKCPDAELLSYVETARALLTAASVHFTEVTKAARNDFDGYPFEKVFAEFDISDVAKSWERVCSLLYGTRESIDLNTPESMDIFNRLLLHFSDGDYVDACMKEAHEVAPEFVENKILVKD